MEHIIYLKRRTQKLPPTAKENHVKPQSGCVLSCTVGMQTLQGSG